MSHPARSSKLSKKKFAQEVLGRLVGSLNESMNENRLLTEPELHAITSVFSICRKHLNEEEIAQWSESILLMIDTDSVREPDSNSHEPYAGTFNYFVRTILGQK